MVLVELFSITIIGGTIFLTLFMLPVYFIRKKKNPNDSKNKISKLVISAFLGVTIMSLLVGSGLIKMYFDDGARLELMNKPEMEDGQKTLTRTGFIHLTFFAGSKEKVDELTKTLKETGYEVISGPRIIGDGYYESCVVGIEGNQIEITI